MIYSNSVLDGFPLVLGSMPVQFAMFLTMVLSIKVPVNTETGETEEGAKLTFYGLLVYHFLILGVKFSQEYISYTHNLLYKGMLMFCLFFTLLTMNYVLGNWVYD